MVSSIGSTSPVQPTVSATSNTKTDTATSKQQSSGSGVTDSVQLSSTAQAQLTGVKAVIQEATETPAQTAKEALSGDRQAQRVQAQEAQAKLEEYGPGR